MEIPNLLTDTPLRTRRVAWWLAALLGLSAFRVLGQLLVAQSPRPYLPDFHAWHSAVLLYPALLVNQLAVLAGKILIVWRFCTDSGDRKPVLGQVLYTFAWLYWSAKFLRLLPGLTLLQEVRWFAQSLPALFHLVLANMLMLVGDYYRHHGETT